MYELREHPPEGELQTWMDREAGAWRTLSIALHLRTCGSCRARVNEVRRIRQTTEAALRQLSPEIDPSEAWARVNARGAGTSGSARKRPLRVALAGALPLTLAAGYLFFVHGTPRGDSMAAEQFRALWSRAEAEITRDICCADHDGGGPADDGLFTLSLPDESVTAVVVYEDQDASGSFSSGDLIRYISSNSPPKNR